MKEVMFQQHLKVVFHMSPYVGISNSLTCDNVYPDKNITQKHKPPQKKFKSCSMWVGLRIQSSHSDNRVINIQLIVD